MKPVSVQIPVAEKSWLPFSSALCLGAALLLPGLAFANTPETQLAADAGGASALIGTTNWTPATTIAPTNTMATTYDYSSTLTLRTPQTQTAYTVYADSLTLNSGGSLGFKGSNVIIIPNLIVNTGAKIANSGTSGSPDMARLAGSINLAGNTALSPNGAGTFLNLFSLITNSSGTPTLTLSAAGTVILSASNAFTGTIVVDNEAGNATLQLGTNNAVPGTAWVQLDGGTNAGHAIFDLNGFSTSIAVLDITSTPSNSGYITNTAAGKTSTLTFDNSGTVNVNYGTIADNPGAAGTIALVENGLGTLTLNTTDTYHGSTTINSGTLALGASGSINNTPSISIAAGGTFDVSQISSYTLGSGTSLSASGTGASQGSTAATINGSTTVSLGAQPIALTFTPTAFTGDTSHPSLLISLGALTLNNNSFTVNNASGTPLGAGTYELIQVNSASINENATPAYAVTMTGSGLVANSTAAIQSGGGNVNLIVTLNANPNPTFSNLTPSQSVPYGSASITLSGTVHFGSTYPASGEAVTVSINGNAQATTINDGTGDFSISYNLAGIPASASPYPIIYSYAGDGSLGPATNTSTALTVQKATPAISNVTASQTIPYGTAAIALSGTVSAGSIYPAAGETVSVTIDGTQQNTTISDSTGDFTISYNSANIPGGGPYPIIYSYAGDTSFAGTTNMSTELTVETNTIVENQTIVDVLGFSSLISTNNWSPATTVAPASMNATNYIFITAITLRTPPGSNAYPTFAQSLTINAGGALGFKGNGLVTVPNLILNGGKIANSLTGGTPDVGQLAGSINLTASSTFAPDNAATSLLNIFSTITNASGISPAPVLTCSGGGTVTLSAQNTFHGNVVVAGAAVPTLLQLGTNNALPVGTTVTLNGNTGVNSPGAFDLNGFSQTLSNLTFTSTSPNFGFVTNSLPGTTGTLTLGYGNASETLQYGTITDDPTSAGTVSLAKIGSGTLTLAINALYSGDTIVSAGTLAMGPGYTLQNTAEISIATNAVFDVSQTFFNLESGQVLTGSGMVNGAVQAAGTVIPIGTLTVNGSLSMNGNLIFTVNTSHAQSNDVLSVINGSPSYIGSGTLTVQNLGPGLVAGQTFYLFNQAVSGGNTLTIVPPSGVVFTNNLAVNGSLTVLSALPPQPVITGISMAGTSLVLAGNNGTPGQPYTLLTSTNVGLALSNWTAAATGSFTSGNFSITNTVNPHAPQNFYIIRIP